MKMRYTVLGLVLVALAVAAGYAWAAGTQKQQFVDSHLRPVIEDLEALDLNITVLRSEWGLVSGSFAAGAYDDGRPDENLAQFTEAEITSLVTALATFQDDVLAPNRVKLRKVAVTIPRAN